MMKKAISIKYLNCQNEVLDLTSDVYKMLRDTTLFDYEWTYTTINEYNPVIARFEQSMVQKNITIDITARTKKEYRNAVNWLLEVIEKDTFFVSPGKIVVNNDFYLPCYIYAKKVSNWHPGANRIRNTFSIVSEKGRWMKDVYKVFGASSVYEPESTDRDYPKDYEMDYVPSGGINRLISDSFVPFDFEIVFQGPVVDPMVICGGNIYRVYTTLEEGEILTINSLSKKIYKTKVNGEVINEFSNRDRENYIFEKMPATSGSTYIEHTDGTVVSIRAFTERSEPKWT